MDSVSEEKDQGHSVCKLRPGENLGLIWQLHRRLWKLRCRSFADWAAGRVPWRGEEQGEERGEIFTRELTKKELLSPK